MKTLRSAALSTIVALGLAAGSPRAISANGQEFFPADHGPVDLVYFGIIKDARTGRPVRDYAYITIRDPASSMSIPFTGDRPGHYRSPDVGVMIKELGETVDPRQLEFTLAVPGYKTVKLTKLPRKGSGSIEMSFKLEPEDGAAPAAATTSATSGPSSSAPAATDMAGTRREATGLNILILLFVAAVVVSAIVAVGRTLVPRASTGH